VIRAADRAGKLTAQLLSFGRRRDLSPIALNLNELVGSALEMLRRLIGEHIELRFVPCPSLGTVRADPARIEEVLVNLVVNARDAMPEGGRLTIETDNVELDAQYAHTHAGARPGRYVMLAVSDTGCGMDRETLEHIFEPFFTRKQDGGGTGLGLPTVYGLVKQHGGNVYAYSEPGKGSTFKVYLPCVDEEPGPLPSAERDSAVPGGTETVLVVEDEQSVRELAARALRQFGYTVLEASGPEEALRLCRQHSARIKLVLSDLVMPGTDGLALTRQLRRICRQVKVLYMSGYSGTTVRGTALAPDAMLLQKPFSPGALAEAVRRALDGPCRH